MKNIRPTGRFLRALLGIAALQLGYFWLGGPASWISLALGTILVITALTGVCPLYRLPGVSPRTEKPGGPRTAFKVAAIVILAAAAVGGSYASIFFTRKIFLEDFNAMNEHYKQALFLTGKGDRDGATSNFDQWEPAFEAFAARYTNYRPYGLKGDTELAGDFDTVRQIIASAEPLVRTGDLHQAHLTLEKVRPVFQGMFKRDGFSMLSVALVDFHDAMETMLGPAAAKDAAGVLAVYPAVSEKLKAVEEAANDAEIQAIRKALEELRSSAEGKLADALPAKGDALKTSFVKVYLTRG